MTNDLETMLRSSLHERAHDVEPTPELWRQVDRRVSRRRALPLLVWTAAGVAAAVTAVAVVPGLLDGVQDGLVIDPAQSPSAVESPGEAAPGPVAAGPLTHYVAVADGRLLLRGVNGTESVLWEGESQVRTLAVRPGSTADDLDVAIVTTAEGMFDVRVVRVRDGDVTTVDVLGQTLPDEAYVPNVVWSPDGSSVGVVAVNEAPLAELLLADVEGANFTRQPLDHEGPAFPQLQDWARSGETETFSFTGGGELYRTTVERLDSEWQVGPLERADGEDYVVDVATHPDGRLYRLLAGQGAGSGDAGDAGLGLFLGEEPLAYPDLPTADPSGVWMTAVDGGVFVGLGDDARRIRMEEQGPTMVAVPGTSYAAWIPVAGDDPGPAPTPATTPPEEAPRADGPLSASGVTPYAAIDENGRVAVFTGDGGPGEVIIHEELWAPEAGVRVLDVSVRPGSSAGEVAGVVLLSTADGTELAWFRAAAGETSIRSLGGPFDLAPGADDRRAPVWSPDGGHIAWVEPDGERGWTLRTLGMADDGPTDDDAGFGLDVEADVLDASDWSWAEDTGQVARGTLVLVDEERSPWAGYGVPVERQGDGALAVTGPADRLTVMEGGVADIGLRDGRLVVLLRSQNGWALHQDGDPVPLPLGAEAFGSDLDLDVLEQVSIVTNRVTGQAFVIDRSGGVAPLEADAATTYGFDPIR